MKPSELLSQAKEKAGMTFTGIERKNARIRNGMGRELTEIQGWDVIVQGRDGSCFEFYVAQPPMTGMTQPQPTRCPLGIVPFEDFKVDIKAAIDIFKTQNGGDKFTEVTLCWPLTHPAAPEPYWYFRTNLGNTVVIGANTGQTKGYTPATVTEMAHAL